MSICFILAIIFNEIMILILTAKWHTFLKLLCYDRGVSGDKDLDISGFLLEIIDERELPEYMTMNKGKICG